MTFASVDFPETLSPDDLDHYLESGWFRMGQTIFTTNFLNFNDQYYSAVWLRVELSAFSPDRTFKKLKNMNSRFAFEFKKAEINSEKETLFKKYKEQTPFEAASSLRQLMYGKSELGIFDTHEINVFDRGELIATGFFDIGNSSAAGITSFYSPAYKKYSLGKYLIYQKMEYCKKVGLRYFYPGYFVPGYGFFDYKLSMGKPALEYLDFLTKSWRRVDEFSIENAPLRQMEEKLLSLQHGLAALEIKSKLLRYEYFDANLIAELKGADLFDYPLFLFFSESQQDDAIQIIVYSVSDPGYYLVLCRGVWKIGTAKEQEALYSGQILKEVQRNRIATNSDEALRWILSRKVDFP